MQPVRAALENLHNALDGAAPFDPDTAERDFTIAVDNRTAVVFAASLAVTMAREAPFAHLHMRPSGTLNLAELLDRGAWIWRLVVLPHQPRDFLICDCSTTGSPLWYGGATRRRRPE